MKWVWAWTLSPNVSKMNTGTHVKEGSQYIVCCILNVCISPEFGVFSHQCILIPCQTMFVWCLKRETTCNEKCSNQLAFFAAR